MTQAGTIMGTPAYMSPEQFMGQTVDARTDIYSAGVLLFQLLTGERPFEGSMAAIMHKALNTRPPTPSELSVTAPAALDAVVARAMAKRPEDRFADRGRLRQRAARTRRPAGDDRAGQRRNHHWPPRQPRRSAGTRRRYPRPRDPPARQSPQVAHPLLAGAAVAVLAAIGLAAWLMIPAARTPHPPHRRRPAKLRRPRPRRYPAASRRACPGNAHTGPQPDTGADPAPDGSGHAGPGAYPCSAGADATRTVFALRRYRHNRQPSRQPVPTAPSPAPAQPRRYSLLPSSLLRPNLLRPNLLRPNLSAMSQQTASVASPPAPLPKRSAAAIAAALSGTLPGIGCSLAMPPPGPTAPSPSLAPSAAARPVPRCARPWPPPSRRDHLGDPGLRRPVLPGARPAASTGRRAAPPGWNSASRTARPRCSTTR